MKHNTQNKTCMMIKIHKHNSGDGFCCRELFGNPFALASTKRFLSINRKSFLCITWRVVGEKNCTFTHS